ncbi:hypothetical protein [Aurantimonas sp. Leaf443]|uniref:hypothetical protein n=1 Tax=Aurantimonas sp. Leaf443 TaxID=1736378 RepID=UPI0006FCF04F|nr:hypothetical protein [Aurantimonas sp. Leaf443]KQT82457.1 hypothetical protein ASG48_15395 [Aurantimonas sp. Leaf443]
MIRALAVGLWVLVAALGSTFAAATFWPSGTEASAEAAKPSYFEGLDYQSTPGLVVPVIYDRKVGGYVLATFVYTIDGKLASEMAVPPEPFVTDEAFRSIYSLAHFDPKAPEKMDLGVLSKSILEAVNGRYGQTVIEDVLVKQFDFIPKDQAGGTAGQR